MGEQHILFQYIYFHDSLPKSVHILTILHARPMPDMKQMGSNLWPVERSQGHLYGCGDSIPDFSSGDIIIDLIKKKEIQT